MASPLQKSPIGMLGALDLKTLGENPNAFSETLVPVAPAWDLYLAEQFLVQTATVAITIGTQGGTANISVPQGFMWRVIAMGGNAILGAADVALVTTAGISIARTPDPTAAIIASNLQSIAGFASRSYGLLLPRELWLPSGWTINFAVSVSAITTQAASIVNRLLVQQFPT